MMIACTIICIIQIIRGKQAAERGESVVKSNLEWHRQYNEAAKKEEEKKWGDETEWMIQCNRIGSRTEYEANTLCNAQLVHSFI